MRGYTLLRNVSRQDVALYRFEAKIIGRSGGGKSTLNAAAYRTGGTANNGKSALSAAAYRHTTTLTDELTGKTYDYTRKRGVLGSEILAPADAPAWAHDRQQLWNQVEKVEKRKDAQLARDFIISLPHELKHEQRSAMLSEFLGKHFVEKGYLCDVAYHRPHGKGDDRNHHAHVMVPMRRLSEEGFARTKDRPQGAPFDAWKNELDTLREDWASTMNRHLEAAGRPERVSHLTLEEQGINRAPEPKQGPMATQIEREGRESHAGNDRRRVQAENAERAAIEEELASVVSLAAEAMKRGRMNEPSEKTCGDQVTREAAVLRELAREDELLRAKESVRDQAAEAELREIDQRVRYEQFKKARAAEAEEATKNQQANKEQQERAWREGDISDPQARYSAALGKCYNIKDPYTSLAEAAAAEGAAFAKEQQELRKQAAAEQDPEKRHEIDLRRRIEACEYMSLTTTRIAGIGATIAGREDAPQVKIDRDEALAWNKMATQLREERAQLHAAQEKKASEAADNQATPQREGAEKERGDKGAEISDVKAAKLAKQAATNAAYDEYHSQSQERGGGRGR
jgi:hypothetical protein